MDINEIKNLVEFFEKKDFVEVEYENQGVRLRLRRAEPGTNVIRTVTGAAPQQESYAFRPPQDSAGPGEIVEEEGVIKIESPMVGTFYRAPSPGADPFVEEGKIIEKGQVLCIIEAMKVMNEIESEVRGRIKSVLIENGQPVGYAEPLFIIEPL
jgi:acetyl-CoA carboxylase biotin carboxyl carrier protein